MRGADAHRLNTYSHQHFDKVAQNSLKVLNGDVMTLDNGAMRMALPGDFIEGIAVTTDIFASDNETGEKRTVNYRPVFRQNTYKLESLPGQTFSIADVGKFFQLAIGPDGTQYADHASANPSSGQFRLEGVIDDLGQFVEVRFVPTTGYQPAIAGAPANVISYNNPICGTPVANVQDALDEITAILCPTANLAHVPATITSPSGSIITGASGTDSQTLEVDVNIARLQGQVSAMETQTTLDQVDIISSGNIITSTVYYTGENGNPQAQSDSTTIINTGNFLPTPTGLKIEINGVTIGEVPRSAISPNITIDTNDTLNISPNGVGDLILTFTDDSNSNNDQQTFNLSQYFGVQTTTDANGVTTITQNGVPLATIHSHANGNGTTVQNNPNGTIAINLVYDNDLKIVNGKLGIGANLVRDTDTALSGYYRRRSGSAHQVEIEDTGKLFVYDLARTTYVKIQPNQIHFQNTNADGFFDILKTGAEVRMRNQGYYRFIADFGDNNNSGLAYAFYRETVSGGTLTQRKLRHANLDGHFCIGKGATTTINSPGGTPTRFYVKGETGFTDTVFESSLANYSGVYLKNLTSASPTTPNAQALGVTANGLIVTIEASSSTPTAPVSGGGTSSANNIASTTVDLTTTCTFSDGGDPITDQGRVVYPGGTGPSNPSAITFSTTADPFTVTGLSDDTNYCAMPYATNSIGTTYCDEVCFTTLPVGAPTNLTILKTLPGHLIRGRDSGIDGSGYVLGGGAPVTNLLGGPNTYDASGDNVGNDPKDSMRDSENNFIRVVRNSDDRIMGFDMSSGSASFVVATYTNTMTVQGEAWSIEDLGGGKMVTGIRHNDPGIPIINIPPSIETVIQKRTKNTSGAQTLDATLVINPSQSNVPHDMVFDGTHLYVLESDGNLQNHVVRKVDPSGSMSLVASSASVSGFLHANTRTITEDGNYVYVAQTAGNTVRRFNKSTLASAGSMTIGTADIRGFHACGGQLYVVTRMEAIHRVDLTNRGAVAETVNIGSFNVSRARCFGGELWVSAVSPNNQIRIYN